MNIHRYPQALRAIFAVSGMRCGKDILQGANIATSQHRNIATLEDWKIAAYVECMVRGARGVYVARYK
jgi:hypothetical protein